MAMNDLPATDSASALHELIGDDSTATFENDPTFVGSNPTGDASSENLQTRGDRKDIQSQPSVQLRDSDDTEDAEDEDDEDEDDDEFEDVETEDDDDEDEDDEDDDVEDDEDEDDDLDDDDDDDDDEEDEDEE